MRISRIILITVALLISALLITLAGAATHQERQAVLTELASALEENYVFPEYGVLYAQYLRSSAQTENYARMNNEEFAKAVTAGLQGVREDNHLRLMAPSPEGEASVPITPLDFSKSIEAAETLAPGVAYIRFHLFPGDEGTLSHFDAFIEDNKGAQTLIFDLRGHRGGGLAELDLLFSELMTEETVLLVMDTRESVDKAGESPLADGPTLRRAPAQEGVVRREHIAVPAAAPRLAGAKVYVLVSGYTVSAAEHAALAFQRLGRGVVIGETTRGGAHFGKTVLLNHDFTAFVPVGRTFNPDNGEDWEGAGVTPDRKVSAEDALTEALMLHGFSKTEAEALNASLDYAPPAAPSRKK